MHILQHFDIVASCLVGERQTGTTCELHGVLQRVRAATVIFIKSQHGDLLLCGLLLQGAQHAGQIQRGHQVYEGSAARIRHSLLHHPVQRTAQQHAFPQPGVDKRLLRRSAGKVRGEGSGLGVVIRQPRVGGVYVLCCHVGCKV